VCLIRERKQQTGDDSAGESRNGGDQVDVIVDEILVTDTCIVLVGAIPASESKHAPDRTTTTTTTTTTTLV